MLLREEKPFYFYANKNTRRWLEQCRAIVFKPLLIVKNRCKSMQSYDMLLPFLDFVISDRCNPSFAEVREWRIVHDIARRILARATQLPTVTNWLDRISYTCSPGDRNTLEQAVIDAVSDYLFVEFDVPQVCEMVG